MAEKKKINVHKFITTVYNPNLNEFMQPVSDTGMGPSIHEGRIIYGKNKLHLSADGFSLFQIRNELFHLGASESSDFSVDYDSFTLALEPLYKFYLQNRGNYLSKKIESVFKFTDLMLETDYFATKLSKNEIYSEELSLRSRNANPITVKKTDQGYNIYQDKKLLGIESPKKQREQNKFSEGMDEKIVLEEGYEFDSSSGFVRKREENTIGLNGSQRWEERHIKEKMRGQIKGSTAKKIFVAIFLIIIGISVVSVFRLSSNQIIKVDKIQVNSNQAMSGDSIFASVSFTKDIDAQGDPLTSFLSDIKPLHSFIMNIFSITKIIDVKLDGALLIRKDITIDANKTYNYSFPVSTKEPGRHIISVNNTLLEFVILNQSRFDGLNFNIQPIQPVVGENITISIYVTNVGGITDTKNVHLYVNNNKITMSQINLPSGENNYRMLNFVIFEEKAGRYNITLQGLSSKFTEMIQVSNTIINPATGYYKTYYMGNINKDYNIGLVKGPDGVLSNSYGNFIVLINNKNAKNPTYSQLLNFLKSDKTDQYPYKHVFSMGDSYYGSAESNVNLNIVKEIIDGTKQPYPPLICADFAEMLHNNAERAGIRCAYVSIEVGGSGHALNAFETTDSGIVYIDDTGISDGYGPSSCDKIIYNLSIGASYVPASLFPESGWSSTWGNMGTVTSTYMTWDGNWNN